MYSGTQYSNSTSITNVCAGGIACTCWWHFGSSFTTSILNDQRRVDVKPSFDWYRIFEPRRPQHLELFCNQFQRIRRGQARAHALQARRHKRKKFIQGLHK